MINKRLDTGLLLSGLVLSGLILAAPAVAQSALAQQGAAKQSTAQQSSKTSTAKSASAKPAAKPASKPAAKPAATTAKKSPPKPLVYVDDNRNPAKTADTSASKTAGAPAKKTTASTGKASDASASQKPLSADVTKAFQQNCPNVALTTDKSKAGYNVIFEREPGAKGVKGAFGLTNAVHKTTKIEVTSKSGKELFSESGHSTGQLVKDACTAIGTPGTKLAKN